MGCTPWGLKESDTAERLHFHFSLSCIGEGNGNPLQCSCLENPRDGAAWWAAVSGVTQTQTQLKRLSSKDVLIFIVIFITLYLCREADTVRLSGTMLTVVDFDGKELSYGFRFESWSRQLLAI